MGARLRFKNFTLTRLPTARRMSTLPMRRTRLRRRMNRTRRTRPQNESPRTYIEGALRGKGAPRTGYGVPTLDSRGQRRERVRPDLGKRAHALCTSDGVV